MEKIAVMGLVAVFVLASFSMFSLDASNSEVSDMPMRAAISSTTVLSSYLNDDGSPSSIKTGTAANHYAYMKLFKGVVVPDNADLFISFWFGAGLTTVTNYITIGNTDAEHNFTSSTYVLSYDTRFPTSYDAGWRNVTLFDASTKLSDGAIGVNFTDWSAALGSCAVYYDSAVSTSAFGSWYWNGATWTNRSGGDLYFVRLYFTSSETNATIANYTLEQLQLGATIEDSGSYFSGDDYGAFRPENVIDSYSASTGSGDGWATNNYTEDAWINISFNDMSVFSIGDSIIAGHPYHDPDLTEYGTVDEWAGCLQYRLSELLGTRVINRGIGSERTYQILDRLSSDVLAYYPDFVIVEGGVNDIALGNSTDQIIANLDEIYDAVTDADATVIAYTILPNSAFSEANRAKINTTNDWIILQASANILVVDTYGYLEDPSNPGELLAAYDSGDHVHPSIAGYYAMAEATFEDGFGEVTADSHRYSVTQLVFETNPSGMSSASRPYYVSVAYDGGELEVTLSNVSQSQVIIEPIETAYLNFSFGGVHHLGTIGYLTIGEIRIFGALDSHVLGDVYPEWSNISQVQVLHAKNPYPRDSTIYLRATPSVGYINISSLTHTTETLTWSAIGTSATTSYAVQYLDAGTGYKVYQDGEEKMYQPPGATALTFTATGGGEFEILAWNPDSDTTLPDPEPTDIDPPTSDPAEIPVSWTGIGFLAVACATTVIILVLLMRRSRRRSGRSRG